MLTKEYVVKLIEEGEKNFVDFKLLHHKCPVELVHDILCLANADSDSDRYCIYGVVNNTLEIKGILQDDRKTEENIIDILSKAEFIGNLPEIKLKTHLIDDKIIDILIVKCTPYKPYFLREDYQCVPQKHSTHAGNTSNKKGKGIILRAGVIYTRTGCINTPTNGSATEFQMQKMWEERFGLSLDPLSRIKIYLNDTKGWKKTSNSIKNKSKNAAFYGKYPEFTLECYDDIEPNNRFFEHWHLNKTNRAAPYELGLKKVALKYHQTILETLELINVEDKQIFPVPTYYHPRNVLNNPSAYISKSSLDLKIAAILDIADVIDLDRIQFYIGGLNDFLSINQPEFAIELID